MVTTAPSLPVTVQVETVRAGTNSAASAVPRPEASSYSARLQIRFSTVQGEYPITAPEVVYARRSLVTSPQVFEDLRLAEKRDTVLLPTVRHPDVAPTATPSGLASLPKIKISTAFEPHLRQLAVKRIQGLMGEFRSSIGKPEVATIREELRGALLETYKQAVVSPETRSFATAVSLLQDFLRPHWSNLADAQLTDVDARLSWLSSQPDLNTSTLTRFYRELASALKTRISLASSTESEEGTDESDE